MTWLQYSRMRYKQPAEKWSVSNRPERVAFKGLALGDGKISFCMADEQPGEIVAGALIMSPYEIIGLRVEN